MNIDSLLIYLFYCALCQKSVSCQFILLRHIKGIHLARPELFYRVKDCQGFDNHHAGLIIDRVVWEIPAGGIPDGKSREILSGK